MSLVLAALPLAALVLAMTLRIPRLRLPLPAPVALPAAAVLAWLLQLHARGTTDLAGIHARVIEGLLSSLTPLAIVFGAILLFTTLERSGAMAVLTARLRRLSPDPLVQVLLVGWAFSCLVEGLAGFGTPAALAAPILVGLGFPPVRAAAACLVMNTIPVVFGAVGTPLWFGLGELELPRESLLEIGRRAAVVQVVAAPVVVALALRLLMPWRTIVRGAGPIVLVVGATVGASWAVAGRSLEFPSIAGGLAGLAAGLVAARTMGRRGGASGTKADEDADADGAPSEAAGPAAPSLTRAATPLLLTVLILALTRLEAIGLQPLLTADRPAATLGLGPLGEAWISVAAVVGLDDILGTGIAWRMPLLYVPFILPFVVAALLAIPLLGMDRRAAAGAWIGTGGRLVRPAIALAGALVLVKLLMHGGPSAPVVVIGDAAAGAVGAVEPGLWPSVAPLIGALGSFFSGSATVSNLTFGPVQVTAAETLGLDVATVLAMQAVGGAMGNMVCIHNLVAVAAVLGLTGGRRAGGGGRADGSGGPAAREAEPGGDPVSAMLRLTIVPLLAFAACAALVAPLLG